MPQVVWMEKKELIRGNYKLAVAEIDGIHMQAVAWVDSKPCAFLSTADSTHLTAMERRIGANMVQVRVPNVVKQYNRYMGGVDVFDRYLNRFSIVKGHSFKKWYKKLGLAVLHDLTLNAFFTKRLADDERHGNNVRDSHLVFMGDLISGLLHTDWHSYDDSSVLLHNEIDSFAPMTPHPVAKISQMTTPTQSTCSPHHSHFKHDSAARNCRVCEYELRAVCRSTQYCANHGVSLCTKAYPSSAVLNDFMTLSTADTCWTKFHSFYVENGVFQKKSKYWIMNPNNKHVQKREEFLKKFEAESELADLKRAAVEEKKPIYWISRQRRKILLKKARAFLTQSCESP